MSPREGGSNKAQLAHFAKLLAKQFRITAPKFSDRQDVLDMVAALTRQGSYIIFLDEITWMVGKDKEFPGKLKGVWDTQLKKNPEWRLIFCGSVSSWIQKNILQNKGFVGRVSLTIQLEELPLYLKYIEDKKLLVEKGLYNNVDLENFPDWLSVMGLQFENLVLNNLTKIQMILDISPESILSASPYFQNPTKRLSGCQINLLIQTKFTYYIFEIKFSQHIGRAVIDEVVRKISALKAPKTVTIRPVLIYQGELSKQVISENFFSHLFCFDDLLNK